MVCPQCGTHNENQRDQCVRCKRPLHPASMKGKIACAIHANREATTSCAACGMRLCDACAVKAGGIDFCDGCAPPEAIRVAHDEDYEKVPVLDPARIPAATFDARFLAAVLDFGLWGLITGVIGIALWLFTGKLAFLYAARTQPIAALIFWGTPILGGLIYNAVLTGMNGQTLGQQITGVIVLRPDGHILSTRQAIIRTAVMVLSLLPFGLGFAWMIWDKNHETWHDRLARTKVFEWSSPT